MKQIMLERHVNMHFKQSETPSANGSAPRRSLDTPPNKLFKRCGKKLRYRRQPWSGMNSHYFFSWTSIIWTTFQQINPPPPNWYSACSQLKPMQISTHITGKKQDTLDLVLCLNILVAHAVTSPLQEKEEIFICLPELNMFSLFRYQ